ncbi:MAG: LytR/AlgR family response regulator transcription factor [Clostridia bacterium]
MINFALCDDNVQLLSKLKEILETIFLQNNLDAAVTFVSNNIDDLLKFVNSNDVNVLFLDIDFKSKLNGIEIAKEIRKNNKSIYIIFLTGHFEFIVSAFECTTFDFIPKPVSKAKLEKTINRLFDDINANTAKFLKLNHSKAVVNQNLVNYIQKDGMKTIYSMSSGSISSYGSFSNISEELPDNFVRCHKSFIVNIDNISSVDFKSNTIFFKDSKSSKCFIGPKYKNNFMEVLNKYGNVK